MAPGPTVGHGLIAPAGHEVSRLNAVELRHIRQVLLRLQFRPDIGVVGATKHRTRVAAIGHDQNVVSLDHP